MSDADAGIAQQWSIWFAAKKKDAESEHLVCINR